MRILFSLPLVLLILSGACKKNHDEPEPPKPTLSFSVPENFAKTHLTVFIERDSLELQKPITVTVGEVVLRYFYDYSAINNKSIGIIVPDLPPGTVDIIVENNDKKFTSSDFKIISRAKWEAKAALESARYGAVAFVIGTKAYVGTGTDYKSMRTDYNMAYYIVNNGLVMSDDRTGDFKKDWLAYEPSTDQWTKLSDFPGGLRYGATGFAVGGKGYMGLGHTSTASPSTVTCYNDFWEYDPAVNTWTRLPDFPGLARTGAVAFTINNKAYVALGIKNGYTAYNDVWEFDQATKNWNKLADFPGPASFGSTALNIGSKGYILVGGSGQLWEFVPGTNTWTRKADLASSDRRGASAFAIGNKGYFGLGNYYGGTVQGFEQRYSDQDFWEYDPAVDTWLRMDYLSNREAAFGFSIGNSGYIGGGIYLRRGGNHAVGAALDKSMYKFTRR